MKRKESMKIDCAKKDEDATMSPLSPAALATSSTARHKRERSVEPSLDHDDGEATSDAKAAGGDQELSSPPVVTDPLLVEQAFHRAPSPPLEIPPKKRARLGSIAAAAAEQWGLDPCKLEAWASKRGLPGVGVADLVDYRRENPEEDISAELSEIGL
eukprot:TRINITY_DN25043_c0_g2_i1.p1 TRINITY_DN25043_c0_g2~~TRINITY_DN25043_c0_g2_i1.p1  ORF type:complete len:157 (-),score=35.17 TRINITY_DN25043_c0_g2_i1:115-585(-)